MKVLIALDDSEISLRAASEARRLFGDVEYLVVNVAQTVVPWLATGEFGMVYPTDLADMGLGGLDETTLVEKSEAAGFEPAEVLSVDGDPAKAICDAADRYDVDVVVVGSHDKGVLRRLVDPSVAQAVVQGTYRPVLVVSGTAPTD